MADSEVRYERLRPAQIIERRAACPLAYVPLGTLEWHGPHNPVGLDGLKAHALCVDAAERGGGLVFPVLWYGEHRESHLMEINPAVGSTIQDRMGLSHDDFVPGYTRSGTLIAQATAYVELLWKIVNEVHALGFRAVVFLNGHYPLSLYARLAGHLADRHLGVRTWAGHEGELLAEAGDPEHGDHAGKWETSLMMAADEQLVDLAALSGAGEFVGCGRNALESSAEEGRRWSDRIVEALIAKGRELLG